MPEATPQVDRLPTDAAPSDPPSPSNVALAHIAPVLHLAAGHPIRLTREEVKWTRLANACATLTNVTVLDVAAEPNEHTPAEVLVDDILVRHGVMRDAGGARMLGIDTDLNRWLLPFLIETTAALPPHQRGIGQGRRAMYGALPQVLSGAAPLPAATAAADILTSKKDPWLGAMCVWLSLDSASRVVPGGKAALHAALTDGRVETAADVRTGQPLVAAADLRRAGLLIEPEKPHGLSKSTASNITTLLKNGAQHARDLGAHVPGDWQFRARKPLLAQLQDRRRTDKRDVRFDEVSQLAPHLAVIGQLVIWIEALLGVRISEGYGPLVSDFCRREGVGYLGLRRQSGQRMIDRDEDGHFYETDSKDGLKTDQSVREIPIAESLAVLIELFIDVFHTDPVTGNVDTDARLIPGLAKDDASGASSFRGWLDKAIEAAGIERFTPHALRGSLIQMLREEGVSKEMRFRYVGHHDAAADIQEVHYNYESRPWELIPVAEIIEARLQQLVPVGPTGFRLVSPTSVREQFGVGTSQRERRAATASALHRIGWWVDPDDHLAAVANSETSSETQSAENRGRLLSSEEVAERIGCTAATARRKMRNGDIPAVSVPYGKRDVWKAFEADLAAYQAGRGLSVQQVADAVGLSYHQSYELLKTLQLVPADHLPGTAVRVSSEALDAVREEVSRRTQIHLDAMYVSQAADQLDLSIEAVETLIRNGTFTTLAAPNGARARLIPNAQVEAYNRIHPPVVEGVSDDEQDDAVPFGEAARELGVSRNVLTSLVLTRQLRRVKRAGSRHQYVSGRSLDEYRRGI